MIDLPALVELGESVPATIRHRVAWVMSADTYNRLKREIRRVTMPKPIQRVAEPGEPVTLQPMLMGMPIRIRPVEGIALEVEGIIGADGRIR
jgi:hypothetical protein